MSRFTVLGASGVIGRRLVAHLRAGGVEVWAPARGDAQLLRQPLGHVIYAIGITADFGTRPLETVQAHVCVVTQLLREADFDSLLYLSSTRVYAGAASGDEDAALQVRSQNPSDVYNLSKLMGESVCLASGRRAVRVARLSNVVGGEDAETDNFLPSLWRDAQAGQIVLRSALSSAKDYIHIDDVVALLPRIARHGQAVMYNVASGQQISHGQWVERLVALTGCSVTVLPGAPEMGFVPVNVARVCAEFGFVPRSVLMPLPWGHAVVD